MQINFSNAVIEFQPFKINKVKFKQELQDVNWFLVFASDNPNVSYDNFILIFLTLFNNIFPLKVRQVYENTIKNKYITNEIKSLIVKKNKLQRLYAKRPQTYGAEYKRIRNKVTNKLRSARAQFFRNKLTNSRGNSKQIWNTINDVLNRHKTKNNDTIEFTDEEGVKHSDPGSVADMFNKFFVNIGKILANQVIDEGSRPEDYFGVRIENNVNFGDTSFTEIEDLIANLGDAAAGCDNVPVKLVKFVINEIKAPLKHIFNCSLRTGIFPEKLKISKVIPIHKKDNKTEITNYRPISLLPVFSKILERLIYNRLELFLQNNKIIYSNQHGFQPKKSTTSALLNLTDNILESFDKNQFCVGAFLDFSKAFDTVNHSILVKKLEHNGIRNTPLRLIQNYLSNRQQYVHFKDTDSSKRHITHSVPQGSILGPLLFNLYINDIINSVNKLKLILYADDSCFFNSHTNLHTLIENINNELIDVNKWLSANQLTLNIKKSHYIIFTRNKTIPDTLLPLKIKNKQIHRISNTIF